MTDRCPRCMLMLRVCLCAEVPRVVAQTRVVIVHCPRYQCGFTATAGSERQAVQALADHLVGVHCLRQLEGEAS